MIKRLRRIIIFVNMLLVGTVIVMIFSAVCINNYSSGINSLEHGLNQVLDRRIDNNNDFPPPNELGNKGKKEQPLQPNYYVIVELNSDGEIKNTINHNATIDSDTLNSCIKIVTDSENKKQSGQISEYNLMYAQKDDFQSKKIAFADTNSVYSSLMQTILVCLGLFAASLVIIFLISLAMSGLAIKPVKEAWEKQKQFVADASHELKTPLTVILANNNIMMTHKNALVADESKWLESTEEEANHMKSLIDQMLFLAKSDAGSNNVELSNICISDIIEGASLNFEPIAFDKGIEIISDIEPDITVKGNETQMNQLAHILIDNAVKYAEKNSAINITLLKYGESVKFSVNNKGNVIEADDLKHIFDRFYRTEKSRTTKGYGLGLAIAKSIVESSNGKLCVESNAEVGTTFTAVFKTN